METVAVIFGGKSPEHDVSIITALASIIQPLELTKKYKIVPIYITKTGSWYSDPGLKDIELFSSGKIESFLSKLNAVDLCINDGFSIVKTNGLARKRRSIKIDLVFPAMHGTYGEDGSLMGLLELANVPYVGCGLSASSVSMNKLLAKEVVAQNNIKIVNYQAFSKADVEAGLKNVLGRINTNLKYPLFVKPVHLGSSIGISRVQNDKELINGLEVALHFDDMVLVEEEVQNLIEVTLPIIGNEQPKPALLEHPLTKPEDFFDFDAKYLRGSKKSQGSKGSQGYSEIPAKLEKDLYKRAQETGLAVYKALGLSGIARVDMLIDSKSTNIYFNEVNPLPGGLYAHNFNRAGISNVELVSSLIELAHQRFKNSRTLLRSFSTNYLKQF